MAVRLSALCTSCPLPPGRFLVSIFVRGGVDPKLDGLGQLKNPMTSSGIEPATFWLVAYLLNQLCYRVNQNDLCIFCLSVSAVSQSHPACFDFSILTPSGLYKSQSFSLCNPAPHFIMNHTLTSRYLHFCLSCFQQEAQMTGQRGQLASSIPTRLSCEIAGSSASSCLYSTSFPQLGKHWQQ
jgi:hypothetical protein